MSMKSIHQLAERIRDNVGSVIVGKEDIVDKLLIAIITSGHVLLEDVPGTGKTLLAKALAKSLDCSFKRIQFTPDLLPSDLSGIHYYNQKLSEFEFRPGPLFANLVLADEINRATPRTQSSLLECMEERQLSIDGTTHTLERPFLVIATQNPVEQQGTFPLPEAQLDRFLFKVRMGYPTAEEGLAILKRFIADSPLEQLQPVVGIADILEAQRIYPTVQVSDELLRYMLDIVEGTRQHADVLLGVSPRGSQALLKASQVQAALRGRDYVSPDDIKAMAVPVLAHRMALRSSQRLREHAAEQVIQSLLGQIPVPADRPLMSR
ncbi:AAA family ATPase [Paenibacillus sp. GCM10027626]|uniref:AAA family ATPase n=1 Tax=Paenibacillus sp. GCM10027626 TaxID=3273411 RepID=UPI0036382853